MVFLEEQKRVRAIRYHFNQGKLFICLPVACCDLVLLNRLCFYCVVEYNLIYTGGYVRCLDWSPPYIKPDNTALTSAPNYLAVASYPNNGHRVMLNEPSMKEFGVISIWECSGLALTKE